MDSFVDYCVCPKCRGELRDGGRGGLECVVCSARYPVEDGIAMLLPEYSDDERKRYLKSYEQLATDDLETPVEAHREIRHSVLISFIGSVKGKRVLDIGSSSGVYLRELDAGFKVALDLVSGYLSAIPPETGIGRVCGDAEKLPVRPGFFDVIVISDMLEHLLKPEELIGHLSRECGPDTRIIVHVPWEEDISHYRESKYEFAHLRSFSAYSFAQLWHDFYIRRMRATYPSLEEPVVFQLQGKIPRVLYNALVYFYYYRGLAAREYQWRSQWISELPKRERWLLMLYRPKFKMFELKRLEGSWMTRW